MGRRDHPGPRDGLAVWSVTRPAPPRQISFAISPDEAVLLNVALRSIDVAISPTGDHVAYLTGGSQIGGAQLHIRPLDQLTSETLVTTAEGLNNPFFSPDGGALGFYDSRPGTLALQRVSVRGGPTSTICALPALLFGASWGTDGTIVFGTVDPSSGLWRVAAVGGEPVLLTTPNPEQGELNHAWPEVLPGGHAALFTIVGTNNESQIAVLSLDTGEQKVLVRAGSFPRYAPTGHLLYGVQGNLWAVGFDPDRLETRGDPVPVLEDVLMKDEGASTSACPRTGRSSTCPVMG